MMDAKNNNPERGLPHLRPCSLVAAAGAPAATHNRELALLGDTKTESLPNAPQCNTQHSHVSFQIYVPSSVPLDDFAPYVQYRALLISDLGLAGHAIGMGQFADPETAGPYVYSGRYVDTQAGPHEQALNAINTAIPIGDEPDSKVVQFETHRHSTRCVAFRAVLGRWSDGCDCGASAATRRHDVMFPIPCRTERFGCDPAGVIRVKCMITAPLNVLKRPLSEIFELLHALRRDILPLLKAQLLSELSAIVMQYYSYSPPVPKNTLKDIRSNN